MNLVEKMIGTIKSPKNAMNSIAERPMIEEAVMIVGIYAVLGAASAYLQSSRVTYVFEGFGNMPMQSMITIFSVVGAVISPFLIWLVGTGIVHLISMALGGEGRFYPQMMTVVGYSFIPMLFGSIIALALLLMMEPMTITVSATNPKVPQGIYNSPYIIASGVIGMLMQVWGAAIIFFGVQSAHRLTPSKSAIAAGIPLAIGVVFLILSMSGGGIL